ncbi:hypothetical protein EYF80_032559 [Liparis tanakae]|uniref:Uncharacterized protein n=1 Tax=Liparis tanakae TaxID=230148 RepID=A0A4Z2GVV5_9TELE|nr:hypothetical protein EYF80_032559 [Liparis tanakae]
MQRNYTEPWLRPTGPRLPRNTSQLNRSELTPLHSWPEPEQAEKRAAIALRLDWSAYRRGGAFPSARGKWRHRVAGSGSALTPTAGDNMDGADFCEVNETLRVEGHATDSVVT